MKFKKLWNNRIFRTFVQTVIGAVFGYIAEKELNINSKELLVIIISSISTGLAKVMPLFDEEDKNE